MIITVQSLMGIINHLGLTSESEHAVNDLNLSPSSLMKVQEKTSSPILLF